MCGEKSALLLIRPLTRGSPPHVRGKAKQNNRRNNQPGITPACAGKRKYPVMDDSFIEDHPRMCGEKTKKIP